MSFVLCKCIVNKWWSIFKNKDRSGQIESRSMKNYSMVMRYTRWRLALTASPVLWAAECMKNGRILVSTAPSLPGQKMFMHIWFSSLLHWYLWVVSKPFFPPLKYLSDHLLPVLYSRAPYPPLQRPPWVHFIFTMRSEANPAIKLRGFKRAEAR